MVTLKEAALNMPDEYVSVSTRLPKIDSIMLQNICKKEHKTPSQYIRELIFKGIKKPQKKFLSGKNKIKYNKVDNSFSWFVQLDSGQETEILSNLSDDFLKNLKQEVDTAIKERNEWVHQTHPDSVDVPGELVGGENEN